MSMHAPTETPAPALSLTLFGPLLVQIEGVPMPPVRSRKALWLLALLALRHGRPVEREWLAGTLWPDMDQSQAFANLRPVLSELRRALQEAGVRVQTPDRHRILLDLQEAEVDVVAFDAAVGGKRLADLERAVALYRGPLLEGCTEEWVYQERVVREQNCLQALQTLAEAALSAGDYAVAISYFQRAAGIDPWGDSLRRGWMEALAKSGDRNAALQVYREYLHLLKSDPKAIPDEKTSALYARLRAEARNQADTPVVEASPQPTVTGYLPHTLTDLVGREDERSDVSARLRRSRLVTLTGLGGIGKTRLAREIAAESAREYSDGAWLVALEALSEERLVALQIASVLGLREETGRNALQSVTEHLRKKRLLLVLDNCEHLLKACAQIVGHLLQECVGLRVLATSREALGITGEAVWTVPGLEAPDPEHLPQNRATLLRVLAGYESVQLFLERAQAVQKGFTLNSGNALSIARICFQIEGIPLAIELAAARVAALSVEQIAARLHDDLGLLAGGRRVMRSRQQTLRTTLDWSYALLGEPERAVFRRLSVFVGGWSLEAAEMVCAQEGVAAGKLLDLLTALVDKSLVVYETRNPDEEGRYRLMEIVRQYASERLKASGEADRVRAEHSEWALALAQEAAAQLNSPESKRWLRRLGRELGNFRAARAWYALQNTEAELQLLCALARYWYLHDYFREGRTYLEEALARENAHQDPVLRARALNAAGAMAYQQGDTAAAQGWYEASLLLRREVGDRRGEAETLNNLGNVAHYQGDYAKVQSCYEQALQIFRELGEQRSIAWSLNGLGNAAKSLGKGAAARDFYSESLDLYRELEDKHGIALTLKYLGDAALTLYEYATARAMYEESRNLFQELEDRQGYAWALYNLGNLMNREGDYAEAKVHLEEAWRLRGQSGDSYYLGWLCIAQGQSAFGLEEYAQAQTHYQQGLRLLQEVGEKYGIGWALHGLAEVALEQNDRARVHVLFKESLQQFWDLKDREAIASNLRTFASILSRPVGDVFDTVRFWGVADALRRHVGSAITTVYQERFARQIQQARAALGDEKFEAAWAEGEALSWEVIVSTLLNEENGNA